MHVGVDVHQVIGERLRTGEEIVQARELDDAERLEHRRGSGLPGVVALHVTRDDGRVAANEEAVRVRVVVPVDDVRGAGAKGRAPSVVEGHREDGRLEIVQLRAEELPLVHRELLHVETHAGDECPGRPAAPLGSGVPGFSIGFMGGGYYRAACCLIHARRWNGQHRMERCYPSTYYIPKERTAFLGNDLRHSRLPLLLLQWRAWTCDGGHGPHHGGHMEGMDPIMEGRGPIEVTRGRSATALFEITLHGCCSRDGVAEGLEGARGRDAELLDGLLELADLPLGALPGDLLRRERALE